MKILKLKRGALIVATLILLAVALRILLVILGWPPTNSDEATMGLMARHIAYNGERPIFFYGQNYMGALEAYLGAIFFHLFGSSLLTLRLGVILLTALFLLSIYLLARTIYTRRFALFTLALLCLGSNYIFLRETYATGGSTQTLLFGTLAFLIPTLLGISYHKDASTGATDATGAINRPLRYFGYSCYGLVIGLGLWSDWVVLPFFAFSVVLLLVACWRDWRSPALLFLLLGLAIGAIPLISYNLTAPAGQNSYITLRDLFHGTTVQQARTLGQLWQGIKATIQVSLPTATGAPFCPSPAVDYAADLSDRLSASCLDLNTAWSLGYLLLWLLSALLTIRSLWRAFRQRDERHSSREPGQPQGIAPTLIADGTERRRQFVLLAARLCLLASALLAIGAYSASSAPLGMPASHARYLIGLLIVTPAILWPLWGGLTALPWSRARLRISINAALLGLVAASFLLGTALTFGDVPSAQAADQQQTTLINGLLRIGATRIYTDYWTCDGAAFLSQERIICGVVDNNLQPSHNRDPHYYAIVSADPHAAYVFTPTSGQLQMLEQRLQASGTINMYRRYVIEGYVVYEPG
jgi:4-amino-4-deoxy-L-arabinose transferase-like glycosyltransferase